MKNIHVVETMKRNARLKKKGKKKIFSWKIERERNCVFSTSGSCIRVDKITVTGWKSKKKRFITKYAIKTLNLLQ